jgi:hypothetical protein
MAFEIHYPRRGKRSLCHPQAPRERDCCVKYFYKTSYILPQRFSSFSFSLTRSTMPYITIYLPFTGPYYAIFYHILSIFATYLHFRGFPLPLPCPCNTSIPKIKDQLTPTRLFLLPWSQVPVLTRQKLGTRAFFLSFFPVVRVIPPTPIDVQIGPLELKQPTIR